MTSPSECAEFQKPSFSVTMMHHPAHHVPDLDAAERWFKRVFGRTSTPQSEALSYLKASLPSSFPKDYSTWTPINDGLFDSIDPKRFVIGGVQQYPTVDEPHLKDLGWYIDGLAEAYRAVKRNGIRVTSTYGELLEADDVQVGPNELPAPFHSVHADTGLRYQFYPSALDWPVDPRKSHGWILPSVSDDDPLGIERCSHHTILTAQPARALGFVADLLGGEIVHEARSALFGTTSTYVYLGDGVLEYAVPDRGTAAHADWVKDDPNDTCHAITWKVVDLDRVKPS